MRDKSESQGKPSRRDVFSAGAALLGTTLVPAMPAQAKVEMPNEARSAIKPPDAPPGGYNILFILVDQEHFFDSWPFPVPAREWIKKNGITFTNHQAASCVCSPARSTIYTGEHIQHTKIFDNANSLWQADMSTAVKTIGHRMAELGYHAAYQGKWHLSVNLDQVSEAIEAPLLEYRKIIESYGFQDFFGVGDINDTTLGGYNYDDTTTAFVTRWLRTKGQDLRAAGTPWYLAVNFVNPHDVMYVNSDLPGRDRAGQPHRDENRASAGQRSLQGDVGRRTSAEHAHVRLSMRRAGRRRSRSTRRSWTSWSAQWPDEDRRWRLLQNYYFNCIRDCDLQVHRVLESLRANDMHRDTIIVFTADHGELGGHHQMRGKGNSTYRQQNHLPLMIVHPALSWWYGLQRGHLADRSHADAARADRRTSREKLTKVGEGLKGRDFSSLLTEPQKAAPDTLRPGSLFCYNMLSYQDAKWASQFDVYMDNPKVQLDEKIKELQKEEPDFHDRCGIRSVFDGRYRFNRYFAPLYFNTPSTFEELITKNDLELYDLQADPDEIDNLAMKGKEHADLIVAMNAKLNDLIAEEVGVDDGSFLPIRNGRWHFPPASERG